MVKLALYYLTCLGLLLKLLLLLCLFPFGFTAYGLGWLYEAMRHAFNNGRKAF
jgi:hypothetical protein